MPRKQDILQSFLLCDMVVVDTFNKYTLVGVYTNDIISPEFPVRLRLALYGEFIPTNAGNHNIEMDFKLDDKPFAKVRIGISAAKSNEASVISVPGFEVGIDRPLAFTVTAIVNGAGRPKEVLRKRIIQGPIPSHPAYPTVSRPPSEQSPSAAQDSAERRD